MATVSVTVDPELDRRVEAIDPTLDLEEEIARLRKEKDAIILAHYYQEDDLQDLADVVGDSLALAQAAKKAASEVIVFAGVHFMAETAKILNPTRKVVVPDLRAGCSLADGCPADRFEAFVKEHPDHTVITYVNSSARVKALSDLICTSSNAREIVASVPADKPILFAPDRFLAKWVMQETGREMAFWPGTCIVHETFSAKAIVELKTEHPGAEVIAHPECDGAVLTLADYIGSTSKLIARTTESDAKTFIVATEPGVIHQMRRVAPGKTFLPVPDQEGCSCNECPYMRLNTLEKLYLCLRDLAPEVTVPEDIRVRALLPVERMLEISAKAKITNYGD